jgi:hypothetical protein
MSAHSKGDLTLTHMSLDVTVNQSFNGECSEKLCRKMLDIGDVEALEMSAART